MPITYTETPGTAENGGIAVAEIRVSGYITREDYDHSIVQLQRFVDAEGDIRLIEVVDDLGGFDPSVIWPGIKFDFKNLSHITHCAVVTDIGWIGPLSKAAGSVMSTKLRTFDIAHLDAARDWIKSA